MKLRNLLCSTLLVLPLIFVAGCSDDDDHNPLSPSNNHRAITDRIQDKLDFMVADSFRVAGAVVGIRFASDGETWVGTAGKSNLGFDVDVRYNDRFKIGSITKCYVSHLVLMLADQGLIDLNALAVNYFPTDTLPTGRTFRDYLPAGADTIITVRHLLNHTSGLINYNHTAEWDIAYYANPFKTWMPWELLQLSTDHLNFAPGTAWEYSNTGYIYLGLIIQNLTHQSLSEALKTRVFNPLHLGSAEFCDYTNPTDIVDGYLDFSGNDQLDAFEVVTGASPTIAWAAGAMVCNAEDMLAFMKEMVDPALLSDSMQALRMNNKVPMGMIPATYGLGVVEEGSSADPAHYALGHVGGIEGFTAALFRDGYGNLIVVMVNGSTPVNYFERGDNNVAHHIYWTVRDMIAANPPGMPPPRTGFDSDPMKAYMHGVTASK
jgi:D-alanyl-D-alanine carboxypeptidase